MTSLSMMVVLASAIVTSTGIREIPSGVLVECENFKLESKWKVQSDKKHSGFSGKGYIVEMAAPGINRNMPSKTVQVSQPGKYNVWVRAFLGGPTNMGAFDRELAVEINGKTCCPTHRGMEGNRFVWEFAGTAEIHSDCEARIKIKDLGRSPAIVDCILLTDNLGFKPINWIKNSQRLSFTVPILDKNSPPLDAHPFRLPSAAKQHVEHVDTSAREYVINVGGTLDEFNTASYLDSYSNCKRLESKFQPNEYLMVENVGQSDVVNPRLVINGRRDWYSAETILASILRPGMSDAEKAMAIWGFTSSIEVQCHDNNRRVGPHYPDDKSQPSRNTFKERGNPVKAANTYYCSGCQLSATNCVVLLRQAGLGARAVWMCPLDKYECHCVAEAWYDDAWHLFDPERRSFYLEGDNTTVASYEKLHENPGLAARTHDGGFATKYMAKRSHAEEYKKFYPPSVMPVDPDWSGEMSMTLRPGEKFIWLWNHIDKFRLGLNSRNRNYQPYRLANGKIIYQPNLKDPLFRAGILSERNIKTTVQDGSLPAVHSDRAGVTSFVSYKVKAPYPIVGGVLGGRFHRKSQADMCGIYISVNNSDWTKVWSSDKTGNTEKYLSIDHILPTKIGSAMYECYVKYAFTAATSPTDAGIDDVYLEFDLQMSAAGLPSLSVGANNIVYRDDAKKQHRLRISHGWKESSATNPPLPPVKEVLPKDGDEVSDVKKLAWVAAQDSDREKIKNYHVQVSPREDMLHAVSPNFDRLTFSGKPEWEVPTGWFVAGQTYYWRVKSQDQWGSWSDWSPVWSFTIKHSLNVKVDETRKEADGYRGIWYFNQPQDNEYVYKYSGGLGTYCAKHRPLAVYAKEADKTFFCYGGTTEDNRTLLHMVSYYDHKTGMVPRPKILVDKETDDAHDNPVISLDDNGRIWLFSSSHGTSRPSYIWVSKKPYDIDEFEQVHTTAFASNRFKANFSYPQVHYMPGKGFVFLVTLYSRGRPLFCSTSTDGREWSTPQPYAEIEKGHYQVSERFGKKIGTCFNYHPKSKGLNGRTNLYYMETRNFGKTWNSAAGKSLSLPLEKSQNPALIHDFKAEKKNIYMKDIAFDAKGNPIVLFITSDGWKAGPKNDPRTWCTARWTGHEWDIQGTIKSDNNYDMGSLYVEDNGTWRIIAPTEVGPQPFNPGGEVVMWLSKDQGVSWKKIKSLTFNSEFNHNYCRRPLNAHPDFYAFWADGHGRKPSPSRLYFTNRDGDHVWRLPVKMEGPFAKPEIIW